MYNFLELVNDVNKKVNEVPLTSATFSNASGVYSDHKNAVNSAIRKINQHQMEWPFNHVTKELILTPNQVRYGLEPDCSSVVWDTFRIKGELGLNNRTTPLFRGDYEDYVQRASDMEYQPDKYKSLPTTVIRTPGLSFAVVPPPRLAYTLVYEYFKLPVDLENATDVPSIPEAFRYVIFNGAMTEAYMFRGDTDGAQISEAKFTAGLEDMRILYINRFEYVRSPYRGRW